jgi:hypothetical protein
MCAFAAAATAVFDRELEDRVKSVEAVPSLPGRGSKEDGFALILALLALMLLTFLGLTLATSTSTELQVATNYRWSQQAYYNAEAGMEAVKIILRRVQDPAQILPVARPGTWPEAGASPSMPATAVSTRATRNFENWRCDRRGNGVGYGAVVDDSGTGSPYENVTTMFGSRLKGGFTIWVRRNVIQAQPPAPSSNVQDDLSTSTVVITSEGVAPNPNSPNRAVRVLEQTFRLAQPCDRTENELSSTGASPCLQ